jgi:host factor-I protein
VPPGGVKPGARGCAGAVPFRPRVGPAHRAIRDRRLQCVGAGRLPAAGIAFAASVSTSIQSRLKVPDDPKNRQFLQLNRYRRERTAVHVYLLSGTRFTGRIRSFDVHTVLLETQHGEMVIYGHAISTIEPATAQRGRRPPGAGGPPRRAEGGHRRDGEGGGYRRDAGEGRGWPAEPRPAPQDAGLPADDAPQEQRAPAPAAPTVTIVRRRSRLIPRD